MADHEEYIRRALELARAAADNGNEPFGALLVREAPRVSEESSGHRPRDREGEIVAESENTVNTDDDITAHPELKLARWAARELDEAALRETTMYTSTEPCAMCSGAIYIAGLRRIVYSVSAEQAGELVGTDLVVPSADVFERGSEDVETVGPVLSEAGERVHEECWPEEQTG